MTTHTNTSGNGARASGTVRLGAALLIAVSLAAIVVHGKTGRGPKLVLAETAETVRAMDRPQLH